MTGVKFKDMSLLGTVVKELSSGAASLDMNARTFRTYPGQPNKCDATIKMPGRHDVGLTKQADGSYSPLFDPYGMDNVFTLPMGNNRIGAIQREYAMREAEYQAAQNGYTTQRVEGKNGTMTLEIIAS